MRKAAYFLLLITILSFSCNKKDDDVNPTTDAQIYSIKITGDTLIVDVLNANAKFTIDQLNNQIYNRDSLPFGTKVGMVKCLINTKEASKRLFYPDPVNFPDSVISLTGNDSIDLSKRAKIKIVASDGVTSKTYDIWINTYSIKADSFVWSRMSEQIVAGNIEQQRTLLMPDSVMHSYIKTPAGFALYGSHISDGAAWAKYEMTGFPPQAKVEFMPQSAAEMVYVTDAAGELYQSADGLAWERAKDENGINLQDSVKALLGFLGNNLELIIGARDIDLLATYSPANGQMTINEPLPEGFPVGGFASVGYRRDYRHRLLLLGGENNSGTILETSWMKTENQSWVKLTPGNSTVSARRGAVCVPYDNKLMLIGGLERDSIAASNNIYFSLDSGLSWVAANDSLQVMPVGFAAREKASVFVDNKNYVYIVGGESHTSKSAGNNKQRERKWTTDVWRGRIHRLSK